MTATTPDVTHGTFAPLPGAPFDPAQVSTLVGRLADFAASDAPRPEPMVVHAAWVDGDGRAHLTFRRHRPVLPLAFPGGAVQAAR